MAKNCPTQRAATNCLESQDQNHFSGGTASPSPRDGAGVYRSSRKPLAGVIFPQLKVNIK